MLLKNNLKASNISLPLEMLTETPDGCAITWSSNRPDVIAIDGTVTQPLSGTGNTVVTLIATLQKGEVSNTKRFTLTVPPQSKDKAEETQRDLDQIDLSDYLGSNKSIYKIISSLKPLPAVGVNGSELSWSSSTDLLKLNLNGSFSPIQTEEDTYVTLTVTASNGEDSLDKDFLLTIPALVVSENDNEKEDSGSYIEEITTSTAEDNAQIVDIEYSNKENEKSNCKISLPPAEVAEYDLTVAEDGVVVEMETDKDDSSSFQNTRVHQRNDGSQNYQQTTTDSNGNSQKIDMVVTLPCSVTHLGPDGNLFIDTTTANTHIRVQVSDSGTLQGEITDTEPQSNGATVNMEIDKSLKDSIINVTESGDIEMQGSHTRDTETVIVEMDASNDGSIQSNITVVDKQNGNASKIKGPDSSDLSGNKISKPVSAKVRNDKVELNIEVELEEPIVMP